MSRYTKAAAAGRRSVVLKLLSGAEPWLYVEHPLGAFKLPASCSCLELMRGIEEGWRIAPKELRHAEQYVRVRLVDAAAAGLLGDHNSR